MDKPIDAPAGDEIVIEPTYVEAFGLREEVFGFTSSVTKEGYTLQIDLARTDEFVKKLADAFLNQVTVELKITEGPASMAWANVMVDAMYGFKSFSCSTVTKPAMQ